MSRLDDDIDRLYQGSLSEFTAERNALAKRAGARAGDVRALQKPTVPAWAVNQLYWQKRPVYEELIERANDLRATHGAALSGRRTDLRGASKAHDEALDKAIKATLALLEQSGHPLTDQTRQAIGTTLRELPGDEPPGRLSRQLEPRGFGMLTAAPAPGRVREAAATKSAGNRDQDETAPRGRAAKKGPAAAAEKARAAKLLAAKEALAGATRAARDAEHVVRREEFEAARATRDAEKAMRRVTEAEEAMRQAEAELAEARRAATSSEKNRDAAQARASKAARTLDAARDDEQKARKNLEALQ